MFLDWCHVQTSFTASAGIIFGGILQQQPVQAAAVAATEMEILDEPNVDYKVNPVFPVFIYN